MTLILAACSIVGVLVWAISTSETVPVDWRMRRMRHCAEWVSGDGMFDRWKAKDSTSCRALAGSQFRTPKSGVTDVYTIGRDIVRFYG